jgi:iron complex outermembrane receptor protein
VAFSRIRFALALASGLAGVGAWAPQPARAQEPEAERAPPSREADALDLEAAAPEPDALDLEPAGLEPEAPEDGAFAGIEEILVTSQGREQTSQEASISVAAFSAEYMEALGARNIADLSQFTPNLEIRTVFSASNPTLFIRGVGLRDFNANSASSVAVYNDDVYMNSPAGQLGQLFDLQQVEVLRGPQGALYGRNASAGVIRLISRKPVGNEVNGFVTASYGRLDQIDLEGAIEVPLVSDLLSMRISGVMHRRDGHTTNRCADDAFWRDAQPLTERTSFESRVFLACFNRDTTLPTPDGQGWDNGGGLFGTPSLAVVPDDIDEKVNDRDDWAYRGLLRLQPMGGSDWTLNVHGGRNRAQARQFQTVGASFNQITGEIGLGVPDLDGYLDTDLVSFETGRRTVAKQPEDGHPFQGDYNRTGPEELDLLGANVTGEIPVGDGTLSIHSVTAWEWNERLVLSNVDASPFIGVEVDFGNTSWQASQDLKAFWDAGGSWTWLAGLNFLFEELDVLNDFRFSTSRISRQNYTQHTYYGSAYGYLTWAASDELSVEGGMRWNVEHKDYAITANLLNLDGEPLAPTQLGATDVTEHAPSGDISINYRPYDDVNFYAKFSRGWKGPHINGIVINPAGPEGAERITPVEPESVNALEIGFKSKWLDDRLRLDTAAFYYDYEDIQVFQVRNSVGGLPVQELVNASDADVYGIEVELEARPLEGSAPPFLEGLTLYGSFGWLESRYTDFVREREEFVGLGRITRVDDFSGNQLINAPRFAFSGFAQWNLPLGRYGFLVPRLDWSFKDEVFFSPANIEPVGQGDLWLLNARLAYRTPDEAIEVAGWVRNFTDEVYRLDVIDLTRFQRSILYAMGDPRTYGITLSVRF